MSTPDRRAFVSYAREDAAFVEELSGALRPHHVDLWVDKERLTPGGRFTDELDRAVERALAKALAVRSASDEERDR